jgi:hypothetical protein
MRDNVDDIGAVTVPDVEISIGNSFDDNMTGVQ